MPVHDGLPCGNTDQHGNVCRCRHVWGSCDCPVCTEKRATMIEKGDAMLAARKLNRLTAPDESEQDTLGGLREVES